MKRLLLFSLILLTALSAQSQDHFKPIDSIVKLYEGKLEPGFSIRVVKDGKTIYSKNVGYADLTKKEKITDKTVFNLASVSKQFTASCIVLLEQQGKLSFEDPLSKYIPEFPAYAEEITINQLINHTGGLKDFRTLAMLRGENSDDYGNSAIKDLLTVQEPNDKPGSIWSYSNSGYWCLVQIIEKVSGESMAEFAHKNIFRPLKMKSTRYVTKPNNKVDKRAIGYKKEDNTFTAVDIDEYAVGGAGVYSTATDLQKWLSEMETHRHFGDAFWNTMIVENPAQGEGFTYTKGLFKLKYLNHTMINHGGDVVGFHPLIAFFPDDRIAVIILSNDDDFERHVIFAASIDLLLGAKYEYPKTEKENTTSIEEETVTIDQTILDSYTGNYELAPYYNIKISSKDGKLLLEQLWDGMQVFISPTKEEHHFAIAGAQFTFGGFKDNKAGQLRIVTSAEDSIYKRMDKDPDFGLYDKYNGLYFCKSLNANIEFFTQQGILRYRLGNKDSFIASPPEGEDTFFTRHGEITFIKDDKGTIKGFFLNHERAMHMEFIKQKNA